jgi:hypothetical protein
VKYSILSKKTASFEEDKNCAFSSTQCTGLQINQNDGKIAWIRLRIASSSTVFSRSGPQWLFLFAILKRMLTGKKFSTNEEVIAQTEAWEAVEPQIYPSIQGGALWVVPNHKNLPFCHLTPLKLNQVSSL